MTPTMEMTGSPEALAIVKAKAGALKCDCIHYRPPGESQWRLKVTAGLDTPAKAVEKLLKSAKGVKQIALPGGAQSQELDGREKALDAREKKLDEDTEALLAAEEELTG